MEIRPANANGVAGIYKQNMRVSKTKETDNTSTNKDVVSISEDALRLSGIGKAVRSIASEVDNDISAEKISSLRAAIENGTYSVLSETIADAILSRVFA